MIGKTFFLRQLEVGLTWKWLIQGVPKKIVTRFLDHNPRIQGLGSKVRPILKKSGNSASDGHINFVFWSFGS